MDTMLVTGSSGLIGSEVCRYFAARGWRVHGCDNNSRRTFFGPDGDTRSNQKILESELRHFTHHEVDIRNRANVAALVTEVSPMAIVHTAAQPSHDFAASIPFTDFDTNAAGTLNVLESARVHARDAVFVHLSTNKVYGDRPNLIPLRELPTRWDFARPLDQDGVTERTSVDQCKHSLFGASKLAADIMVQEYGRYFGMKTCCLRSGCLTGPNHSGVEHHGFLSYLIKCNVQRSNYTIYGFGGKQVRDNLHAYDVACFIHAFIDEPRTGEVYNLGGGRKNSCSILEAFDYIASTSGQKMTYRIDEHPRSGDHICYISSLQKIADHYPQWSVTRNLDQIFEEIYMSWKKKL